MAGVKGRSGRKPGTPDHVPTQKQREAVAMFEAMNTPQEQILAWLGISAPTYYKYYRAQINAATIHAIAGPLDSLRRKAESDDPAIAGPSVNAAKFLVERFAPRPQADAASGPVTIHSTRTFVSAPPAPALDDGGSDGEDD